MWVTPGRVHLPPYLLDKQREACLTCCHVVRIGAHGLWCDSANVGCSQARLPGEACGPDAALRNVPRGVMPGSRTARLLAAIKDLERATVLELAARMEISPQNVYEALRNAMNEGRVTRSRGLKSFVYSLPAALPQIGASS